MGTKITDNYFEFGNRKYFRGNAHLVQMCTYGEKKDPAGNKSYLDPQNTVNAEHLSTRVVTGSSASIEWANASRADVEVNGLLKFFGINGIVKLNGNYETIKNAKLKLFNFFVEEGKLQAMLNTDATAARNYLADEGNDGRIVSEIWVAMEAALAEHFSSYGSASIGAKALGSELQITATGGKLGSQSITISPGTVFAYKLHKVKNWTDHKSKVDNMEADYYGMS